MTDEPRTPPGDEPQPATPAYEPPSAEEVSADDPVVTGPGGITGVG
jgi:hypothetical protein